MKRDRWQTEFKRKWQYIGKKREHIYEEEKQNNKT